jgi:hypothetical protein
VPHYLATTAMKKKRRSDKVPALSNVDTEKEKTICLVVPLCNDVGNGIGNNRGYTDTSVSC